MLYSKYCRNVAELQMALRTIDKDRFIQCVPDMNGGFVVIYR